MFEVCLVFVTWCLVFKVKYLGACMLNLSDLQIGTYIIWQGEPAQIIWRQHSKLGRGGAILRTKIRGIKSGAIYDNTFKGNDKVEEAEISHAQAQFLYADDQKLHFMDQADFDQFELDRKIVGKQANFLKDGTEVDVLQFNGQPLNIQLPYKIELKVTYAEPAVRGNTAQGNVTKQIELESGVKIQAPLFVKQGDTVRVNTQTGEYVERA